MFRPTAYKLYDEESPDYGLAQSMMEEAMQFVSPKILWWRYDHITSESKASAMDKLYGENSKGDKFLNPIEVFGWVENNPILQELTRLGLEENEEINLFCDTTDLTSRLGREPQSGDILRISYIKHGQPDRHVFYKVANNPNPRHLFDFRYMNYQINAEKTDMGNVPALVKNYFNLA